jgi:hypothetical protein
MDDPDAMSEFAASYERDAASLYLVKWEERWVSEKKT